MAGIRGKQKEKEKPYRIMSLDARGVILSQMCEQPVLPENRGLAYRGSISPSLERIRLMELCEEKEKGRERSSCRMLPFFAGKKDRVQCTHALVDMKFRGFQRERKFDLHAAAAGLFSVSENALLVERKTGKTVDGFLKAFAEHQELYLKLQEEEAGEGSREEYREEKNASGKIEAGGVPEGKSKREREQKRARREQRRKLLRNSSEKVNEQLREIMEEYVDRTFAEAGIRMDGKAGLGAKIRRLLYEKGFDMLAYPGENPVHYDVYKRSGNKAKAGTCLFIWSGLRKEMMEWTWLDLPYWKIGTKEGKSGGADLTSAKAYEALVMSTIEGTVRIEPESILMIDSVESPSIRENQRILVRVREGEEIRYDLITPEEYDEICEEPFVHTNVIWDGQALVDESVFQEAGFTGKNAHGMMLLRNSFFKACAFNTRIREYYRENGIKKVTDMFGNTIRADRVKMIVTPDSLKFLKFAGDFAEAIEAENAAAKGKEAGRNAESKGKEAGRKETKRYVVEAGPEANREESAEAGPEVMREESAEAGRKRQWAAAYFYWKRHISDRFGIVKTDKASHLGRGQYHEVGYQALNTLPLSGEDMRKLMKEDLRYLDLLKNSDAVMMHHMRFLTQSVRKRGGLYYLYKYFRDFERTEEFKRFRNQEIQDYKRRMREGRLKLRGDFYTLCSMPMEMLEYSGHGRRDRIVPYLEGDQACIPGFPEGKEIILFRYPHMSSGAVGVLRQHDVPEIKKWFNLENRDGSNIVILSPWQSNIMVRLGGADFDSDTALFIRDDTVLEAVGRLKELQEKLYPGENGWPVAEAAEWLKSVPVKQRAYDAAGMAELDFFLAETGTNVGAISNDAQLFNSYFWQGYFDGKDPEYLRAVFDCILRLSVLNELEIDRAKHEIAVNTMKQRKLIRETEVHGEKILRSEENGRAVSFYYPSFLYDEIVKKKSGKGLLISGDPEDRLAQYWNCPVDQIGKILAMMDGRRRDGDTGDGTNPEGRRNAAKEMNPEGRRDAAKETNPEGRRDATKEMNPEGGRDAENNGDTWTYEEFIRSVLKEKTGKPNDKQKLPELLKQEAERLDRLEREQQEYDDDDKARERELIQTECVERLASMKLSEDTVIQVFERTYATYASDAKKGAKEPHKKGDPVDPVLAKNKAVRGKAIGFLFMAGEEMTRRGRKNAILSCFRTTDFRRDTLRRAPEKRGTGEKQIELWGDWYDIVPSGDGEEAEILEM